ncbi:MAG: hypothetical protein ACUVQK_05795 [Thermogutta sp.]
MTISVLLLIVLGFLLLPAVLMTRAMPSRGAAAVLAGILEVTFLLLIGAVGWVGLFRFRTAEAAESRTRGMEFGPPGEDRSVPNSPKTPRPPDPPAPEPSLHPEPALVAAVPPDSATESATEPSAAAQSAVLKQSGVSSQSVTSTQAVAPIRSPTPIATAEQSSPPGWVDQGPARVNGEYCLPIRVGPYTTPLECEQSLLSAVHQAVDEYAALYLGEEARGRVRLPRAFIEEHLIRERWYENRPFLVTSTEQAEMTFLHVLLVFDSETNEYLQSLWRSAVSLYRVGVFTAAFAGVLWLLTVAWSYLKLDQISAGRYRGRLRAAAAIAVILPPLLLALLLGFGEMPALVLSFGAGA